MSQGRIHRIVSEVRTEGAMIAVGVLCAVMLGAIFGGGFLEPRLQSSVFAVALIGVFGILMVRNLERGRRGRPIRILYGLGWASVAGVILAIIHLPREVTPDELWLGMPPATALLVFGIGLFPFSFLILWAAGFSRAVLPPEKERLLERLKAETPPPTEVNDEQPDSHS